MTRRLQRAKLAMSGSEYPMSWLGDARLAEHALSPSPVWLWRADGHSVLWCNPTAAAIFDAGTPKALTQRDFGSDHPCVIQIARLTGTLPQGGASRLERLRGFGAKLGGMLTCLCTRIMLADGTTAILVVSTERTGREMSLPQRASSLMADIEDPAAIFSASGDLIEAKQTARPHLDGKADLNALGAEKLAREANLNGAASGDSAAGPVTMLRLGAGATVALLIVFTGAAKTVSAPALQTAEPSPRGLPFRFLWQMDAATRITYGAENFVGVLGPQAAELLARPWVDVASEFQLDNDSRIARALAARETWSGIVVPWPIAGTGERVNIEMSGMPVFDRERQFQGFRGFAICRETARLDEILSRLATAAPVAPISRPEPIALQELAQELPQESPREPASERGKVLPFQPPPVAPQEPAASETPALSPGEHSAFAELARELNARLKNGSPPTPPADDFGVESVAETAPQFAAPAPPAAPPPSEGTRSGRNGRPILDRLPIGVLVYRLNNLLYANRAFFDWTGYDSLQTLSEAGGLDALFIEARDSPPQAGQAANAGKTLTITTVNGKQKPVEGRLFSVPWDDESALALMIITHGVSGERGKQNEAALHRAETENNEMRAILDTATDGVLVLDHTGRVLSGNRSAEALFGYDGADFTEITLSDLFAPESRRGVTDYLERLAGGARAIEPGLEAIGRVKQGGLVPLYITMGRLAGGQKICAVLRDVTAWKRTEEELINARRQAERASTAKSEFLARISHEIRTPLNAIIGFSEVMMDERFGSIGNERYKQYLKDIHASGGHLISLINDLLDLSKIEAGKLELSFVSVNLNDLVQQCVAIMQQQANKERVIIRTALGANLPPIVADARSVRQITFNLLSNSIKFTGAGGQVIVSTALNDDNEAVLRVRDTGVGMSENELQTALEPFRQLATASRWGASGTGLGLPITKALAEANHARFRITSRPEDGTLVEVVFPATRVLAAE
jgi:PAS domain S-box-containing protein